MVSNAVFRFSILSMFLMGFAFAADLDPYMGVYEGSFTHRDWKDRKVVAKVVAKGGDKYDAAFEITTPQGKSVFANGSGAVKRKKVKFDCKLNLGQECGGVVEFSGRIVKGALTGTFKNDAGKTGFKLLKTPQKPPSLGLQPPQDAVVLFDGRNLDAWKTTEKPWTLVPDTAPATGSAMTMLVGKGNLASKQEFGDHKLHLEFCLPFLPTKRGQARGNSGVYIQGRYEVQVLDTFGLPPADNGCGGIYKKAVPRVSACLLPGQWQTYDMTFHAPKFDANGAKTANAVITVELNGITIHDNAVLESNTPGGVANDEAATGPLMLQEHGNAVLYRNVWIQPIK